MEVMLKLCYPPLGNLVRVARPGMPFYFNIEREEIWGGGEREKRKVREKEREKVEKWKEKIEGRE